MDGTERCKVSISPLQYAVMSLRLTSRALSRSRRAAAAAAAAKLVAPPPPTVTDRRDVAADIFWWLSARRGVGGQLVIHRDDYS